MKKEIYSLTLIIGCALLSCAVCAPALAQDHAGTETVVQNQKKDGSAKDKGDKRGTETAKFSVSMHCENCVKKITENISYEKGVKDLDISLEDKTVAVTFDPSKTDAGTLAAAIRKLGYTVESLADPAECPKE